MAKNKRRVYWETPSGGDYAEMYVWDDEIIEMDGELLKRCEIAEFYADGTRIAISTYGFIKVKSPEDIWKNENREEEYKNHPKRINMVMWDEDDYNYEEIKQFTNDELEKYYSECKDNFRLTSVAINTFLYNEEYLLEEYGVEKAATMIVAMLFSIKHNDVDHDFACETYSDLLDIESGDYDELFKNKDNLKQMKEDIKYIFEYIESHHNLIE